MTSRTEYNTQTTNEPSLFDVQCLRNHRTLDIGVLGYIGIVWPKEHSPEVRSFPPGTPCILFRFSTCFEQPCAHHQESQFCQYSIWYMSFCVGDRPVCRSGRNHSFFPTCIPDGHLHRMTYTRCCIVTIDSPDDEHKVARNIYRIEINVYKRNCASSWLLIRIRTLLSYCLFSN